MNAAHSAASTVRASVPAIVGAVAFGLYFALASVRFGAVLPGDALDPSWLSVINWAARTGQRWGVDIAFTYGPLGYLFPYSVYDAANYTTFVAAQVALALAAGALAAAAWLMLGGLERVVAVILVALYAALFIADPVWFTIPLLALFVIQRLATGGSRYGLACVLALACAYVGTIVHIKISLLPLLVLWTLATCATLVAAGRRGYALAAAAGTASAVVGAWLATGQQLGDLPRFVSVGMEIARGYGQAQSAVPPLTADVSGALILLACGGIGLYLLWHARRDPARLICLLFAGIAVFTAWRAGFTRGDAGHRATFAVVTAFLLLVWLRPAAAGWLRMVSALIALATVTLVAKDLHADGNFTLRDMLALGAHAVAGNVDQLRHLRELRPAYEAALAAERARLAMPGVRAAVGSAGIDLVGVQQAVLLMNDLNYRPRPVFQNYVAATQRLSQINLDYYEGPTPPSFVMLSVLPIDNHLPAAEDPLTQMSLLQHYEPVLASGPYLLLRRRTDTAEARVPTSTGALAQGRFGEWFDLPSGADDMHALFLQIDLSLAGRLAAFVLREPELDLEVELADKQVARHRILRENARTGMMISPFVRSLDDYVRAFTDHSTPRPVRARVISADPRSARLLRREFGYGFARAPLPPHPAAMPAELIAALYPGFDRAPTGRQGTTYVIVEDNRPALFMHSPSTLSFELPAGSYRVSGEVGIQAAALTAPGCEIADGVVVRVHAGDDAGVDRLLNPLANPAQRGAQPFDVGPIAVDGSNRVRVDIEPGANGNGACDWAYVRNIRFLRLPEAGPDGSARNPP